MTIMSVYAKNIRSSAAQLSCKSQRTKKAFYLDPELQALIDQLFIFENQLEYIGEFKKPVMNSVERDVLTDIDQFIVLASEVGDVYKGAKSKHWGHVDELYSYIEEKVTYIQDTSTRIVKEMRRKASESKTGELDDDVLNLIEEAEFMTGALYNLIEQILAFTRTSVDLDPLIASAAQKKAFYLDPELQALTDQLHTLGMQLNAIGNFKGIQFDGEDERVLGHLAQLKDVAKDVQQIDEAVNSKQWSNVEELYSYIEQKARDIRSIGPAVVKSVRESAEHTRPGVLSNEALEIIEEAEFLTGAVYSTIEEILAFTGVNIDVREFESYASRKNFLRK